MKHQTKGQPKTLRFQSGPVDASGTPVTTAVAKAQQRAHELTQRSLHQQTLLAMSNENQQVGLAMVNQLNESVLQKATERMAAGANVKLKLNFKVTEED